MAVHDIADQLNSNDPAELLYQTQPMDKTVLSQKKNPPVIVYQRSAYGRCSQLLVSVVTCCTAGMGAIMAIVVTAEAKDWMQQSRAGH